METGEPSTAMTSQYVLESTLVPTASVLDSFPTLNAFKGPTSEDVTTIAFTFNVRYSKDSKIPPWLQTWLTVCPRSSLDPDPIEESVLPYIQQLVEQLIRSDPRMCNHYMTVARETMTHQSSLRFACSRGKRRSQREFEETVGRDLATTFRDGLQYLIGKTTRLRDSSTPRFVYLNDYEWNRLTQCPRSDTWSFTDKRRVSSDQSVHAITAALASSNLDDDNAGEGSSTLASEPAIDTRVFQEAEDEPAPKERFTARRSYVKKQKPRTPAAEWSKGKSRR